MAVINGKIMPPPAERDPHDPPVFILLASPTWAPWLPDTAFQKVPIGATGQVLSVNADGSVGWVNNPAGFANPMTTAGDLIDGGAGGTAARLAIGSAGQVLTVVSGLPAWAAAVGFANPMTTSQDLIVGGAAGAAGRLGVGANAQVLGVTAGAVGWVNNPAGFANPMTTAGDIITAATGGAAQRLAAGGNGQVLTVAGGVPAWQNSPTGFANPMTAVGDMIIGGLVGVATRLGAGANGQILTMVSGSPAWAAGATGASAVVFPSGDATGVTDQANITSAYPANGGEVLLGAGSFFVKPPSGLNCLVPPAQTTAGSAGGNPVCLRGLGASTVLFPVGAGVTGVSYHRTANYGGQFGQPADKTVGYLRDFVIDGTNATGASIGLDVGDGWGHDVQLTIVNFTGTGAIGCNQINRVFWTEKSRFRLNLMNNTTGLVIDTITSSVSHEYTEWELYFFCNELNVTSTPQSGMVLQNGVNCAGNSFRIRGNMGGSPSAPTTFLMSLTGGSQILMSVIDMKVEGNGSNFPVAITFGNNTNAIQQCHGEIAHSLANSTLNGGEFSFHGIIAGDPGLSQLFTGAPGTHTTSATPPAVPASGVVQQNYGPDQIVCISGGTVTNISIQGQSTGLTSGAFYINAGSQITTTYTGAPTVYNWVPAGQSSN